MGRNKGADASIFWERYRDLNTKDWYIAEKINVPASSFSSWKNNNRYPPVNKIMEMVRVLDVPFGYLVPEYQNTLPTQSNKFLIPLLNQTLSAGHGADLVENEVITSYIPAPAWMIRLGTAVAALRVVGDSMENTLFHDDVVICDTFGWQYDGIYALHFEGNAIVKRIQKVQKAYRIISDNAKYPTIEEPDESENIRFIGRIRGVVKEF